MTKSHKEHQARYIERMHAKGYVLLRKWVKKADRAQIIDVIGTLEAYPHIKNGCPICGGLWEAYDPNSINGEINPNAHYIPRCSKCGFIEYGEINPNAHYIPSCSKCGFIE